MSKLLLMRSADGDTLFLFNYRSDRMREIATVLGKLDNVVDVEVPNDLVCLQGTIDTSCRC
jgi:bisphosphoglycerate-independent phosphoglycerate mutase (AlkP superfamily)